MKNIITSKNYNGVVCTLVFVETGLPVPENFEMKSGEIVSSGIAPQNSLRTGKIRSLNKNGSGWIEYLTIVIEAEWIPNYVEPLKELKLPLGAKLVFEDNGYVMCELPRESKTRFVTWVIDYGRESVSQGCYDQTFYDAVCDLKTRANASVSVYHLTDK